MKALILAAGYATRLYPLTENKPKCLLEVGGRTILDAIVEKVEAVGGIDELAIVTNSRFYGQFVSWKKIARSRLNLTVVDDGTTSNDNRLGAIGDLAFALRSTQWNDDLLMLASDNLFDGSLAEFAAFAQKKGAVSTGLHDIGDPRKAAGKYGVLELDASQAVVSIEEKPASPRSSLIGMGVYYFPKASLGRVGEYLASPEAKDAPGHYLRWLVGKTKIFGFIFSGMWYDIGDLSALEEANRIFHHKKGKA